MNLATIEAIIPELRTALAGRRLGKIFPLSRLSLAIDFRLSDSRYLFISVEPASPRIYLIRRRVRDLEKQSVNASPFVLQLKKNLSGFEVASVRQITGERVVSLGLSGRNEFDESREHKLICQLTGRSANIFLAGGSGAIIDSIRETLGEGQLIDDVYSPPIRPVGSSANRGSVLPVSGSADLSEALDVADLERKAESEFRSLANAALSRVDREIARLEKLKNRLNTDLESHGDADKWKRYGDLLLASVGTANRDGAFLKVTDYFDENLPVIEIEADANDSITETAEKYFKRYTKARNAGDEIARRIDAVGKDIAAFRSKREKIETAISNRDIDEIAAHSGNAAASANAKEKRTEPQESLAYRTFISSDDFELLVGKKAKDNDHLTFKVAKSLDTWMHAADYPGSHVVIRNPNRKDIPQKTLLEAAQLAAFYSQGKTQPKAAVHYTQKKFVNKPKGSAPGMVSLASFKTLLVEPVIPETINKK